MPDHAFYLVRFRSEQKLELELEYMPTIVDRPLGFLKTFLVVSAVGGPIATFVTLLALGVAILLQPLIVLHQSITGSELLASIMFSLSIFAASLVFGILIEVLLCKALIPFSFLLAAFWSLSADSRLLAIVLGAIYFGTVGFIVNKYGIGVICILQDPQVQDLRSLYPVAAISVGAVIGSAIGWLSFELSVGRFGQWLLKKLLKKTPWDLSDVWRRHR